MRIRIALTTALAVIAGMTTGIITLSTRQPASAAGTTTQHAAHVTLTHTTSTRFVLPAVAPVIAPTPPPPPPPPPTVPVTDANSVATADWQCIRVHESGDRYNSSSAPSGAYGILISTWRSFGLSGWPYQAAASEQDQVALELYARYGFHPWSSRFACGL